MVRASLGVAEVVELSPVELLGRRGQLVELLADAIDGGASVNYVLPFRREDLDAYWKGVAVDAENHARSVLAIIKGDRVMASVQLVPCRKPNQPHRADVEKLLVHSTYRQRGAGTALMNALERSARAVVGCSRSTRGLAARRTFCIGGGVGTQWAKFPTTRSTRTARRPRARCTGSAWRERRRAVPRRSPPPSWRGCATSRSD